MRNFQKLLVMIVGALSLASCSRSEASREMNLVSQVPESQPGKSAAWARINGIDISEDELLGPVKPRVIDLRRQEYELTKRRLQDKAFEVFVLAEAKKMNISAPEYIAKKLYKSDGSVTDSQKRELREEFVAKMSVKNPIVFFRADPAEAPIIPVEGSPSFGPKDAKVQVVEYSDFQCPACRRASELVSQLKKNYERKIHFVFKNFPLPMHKEAGRAAEASLCIFDQGPQYFWPFHDLLYENQKSLMEANLHDYAQKVKANGAKFEECMDSKRHGPTVQQSLEEGLKFGVYGTPTFFINGKRFTGRSFDSLKLEIDKLL